MATPKYVEKPGKNGYKILFESNVVIMNKKFAAAAATCDSPEYKIMKQIRRDFPGMNELVVSGREKKSTAVNTRLTYKNMEQYIMAYENAEDLLEVFCTVRALSLPMASPYKYVSDWFKAQFPDYKQSPVFDQENGKLKVLPIPAPDCKEYKKKLAS